MSLLFFFSLLCLEEIWLFRMQCLWHSLDWGSQCEIGGNISYLISSQQLPARDIWNTRRLVSSQQLPARDIRNTRRLVSSQQLPARDIGNTRRLVSSQQLPARDIWNSRRLVSSQQQRFSPHLPPPPLRY